MTTQAEQIFWMMLVAVVIAGASIVLAYMSRWQAVLAAFAALLLGALSGFAEVSTGTLVFWGVATAIAVGICLLLPAQVRDSTVGVPYFCTGALAGVFTGMLLNSSAGIITGSALGILISAVLYARTSDGRRIDFPSRRFFNYLSAKGLPLVVVFSMLGIFCLFLLAIVKK